MFSIQLKFQQKKERKKKKKDKCCTAYYIHFTWKWIRSNWNNFKEVKKMAGGYNKLKTKY